jgi:hypothetical protein
MFRTIGDGPSRWESLLPPEVLRLPEELARVDALLDDPGFFAPPGSMGRCNGAGRSLSVVTIYGGPGRCRVSRAAGAGPWACPWLLPPRGRSSSLPASLAVFGRRARSSASACARSAR